MNPHPDLPPPLPPDVDAWISAHPEVPRADLEDAWRRAGQAPAFGAPASTRAQRVAGWLRLEKALFGAQREVRQPQRRSPRRSPILRRLRWGVLGLFVVGAGLLAYALFQPTTLVAPAGERLSVTLPDGSHIDLNSGSSLSYGRVFGDTHRRLTLVGEAFFDVERRAEPFVIETFNSKITVVGTAFNVRAWPGAGASGTQVAVASGVVRLEALAPPGAAASPVRIEAGHQAKVQAAAGRAAPAVAVQLDDVLAWRDGAFAMRDEPLSAIFAEIERRFAVTVSAPERVLALRWTVVKHDPPSAEDLLRDICYPNGLVYRETATGFEVLLP